MANINVLVPQILHFEGGFVNNPNDKGGATNKGVTLSTFQSIFGADKTVIDLQNITIPQFMAVLKHYYWDKMSADLIDNQSIADICVDWVYNSGTGIIHHIQELVGQVGDNVVGPATVTAINSANQQQLFEQIKEARINFVNAIVRNNPSQQIFLKGWSNRINAYQFQN